VDLNHRPRPYQGLLSCYMHSSVAMITLLKSPSDRFLNYNNSSRTVVVGADPHLLKEMRSLYGRQPEIALAFVFLFACNPSRVDAERGDHFLAMFCGSVVTPTAAKNPSASKTSSQSSPLISHSLPISPSRFSIPDRPGRPSSSLPPLPDSDAPECKRR